MILFSTVNQVPPSLPLCSRLVVRVSSLYFRLGLFRHSTVSKGRTRSRSAGAFRRAAFKGQTPAGTLREVGRRQSRRMDERIQTSAASPNLTGSSTIVQQGIGGPWTTADGDWARVDGDGGGATRLCHVLHAIKRTKVIYIATWFTLRLCKYCI